jgi:hypothetical protein
MIPTVERRLVWQGTIYLILAWDDGDLLVYEDRRSPSSRRLVCLAGIRWWTTDLTETRWHTEIGSIPKMLFSEVAKVANEAATKSPSSTKEAF